MKSSAYDTSHRKLMMKKLRDESRMFVEKTTMKMLADPSLSKAMDEEEVLRLISEAKQRRKQTTLKRKELQAHQQAYVSEDPDQDYEAFMAARFRDDWEYRWSGSFGCFEDTTPIPAMRYTNEPPQPRDLASPNMHALNIFSVKLAEIHGDLQWPMRVFGMVAARDSLDHNRNIIFSRSRADCQIIYPEYPYLELTGPTRGVVVWDTTDFEVELRVKGSTESEDKVLSYLLVQYCCDGFESRSHVFNRVKSSKLSTLELTFGHIVRSVEATVSVKVIGGSWPDGYRGLFTANTTSIKHMKVSLLAFGDGQFPIDSDGMVKLSCRVACVELDGALEVSAEAQFEDEEKIVSLTSFTATDAGRSSGKLKVGSCVMEVSVAWSVFSCGVFVRGERAGNKRSSSPPGICDEYFDLASQW